MTWAGLLNGLVKLVLWVFNYLERRQIAVEATRDAARELRKVADEVIQRSNRAISELDHSDAGILRDDANRDRAGGGE